MKKLFTTMACALLLGAYAMPAGAVGLNEPFLLNAKDDINNNIPFVAPQTGTLTAVMDPGLYTMLITPESILYLGKNQTNQVPWKIVDETGIAITVVSWEVTQDTQYYFCADLMTDTMITLTMDEYVPEVPEGDVEMGVPYQLTLGGEPKKFYCEEEGVLTVKFSSTQVNSTEKASVLFTQWSDVLDPDSGNYGQGLVSFTTNKGSGTNYTEQYYDVHANMLYYIATNNTLNNVTVTLSFQANSDIPVQETEIDWNINTAVVANDLYYIMGNGEASHIEANKADLEMGNLLYISKAGEDNPITLIPAKSVGGIYYYNLDETLATGEKYTVAYYAYSGSVSVKFVEGLVEMEEKEPVVVETGSSSLDAYQPYYYTAGGNGVMTITTEQCPATEITESIIFSDAAHTQPLEGVNVGEDAEGNYMCSFEVRQGTRYYIYFTTPNYIVATLTYSNAEIDVNYMSAEPKLYFNNPTLILYWNETLTPVNEGVQLEGMLTTPTGANFPVGLTLSTFYPNVEDEGSTGSEGTASDNALLVNISGYIETFGIGTYAISLESIVKNAAGEVNRPLEQQAFPVDVQPSASEAEYDFVLSGDQIIISWGDESTVVEYYNPDGADVWVTLADYSEDSMRLVYEDGVSIEANSLIIDLSGLNLEEGVEYEVIVPEMYVLIDDAYNTELAETFIAESTAIGSLNTGSDSDVIYDLNGRKVQRASKGIFIINGKKVVVR